MTERIVLEKPPRAADVITPPPTTPARVRKAKPVVRRPHLSLRLITIAYVGFLVIVPLTAVFWRTVDAGWTVFRLSVTGPIAMHAFQLTAIVAGSAVLLNTVFGLAVSLLLARTRFPGRRLLDLLIDLPVSVSPIVVGLALILVYGPVNGWFGPTLGEHGVQIIFSTPGMVLATAFVSLPLVVRSVVPVLVEAGIETDEAARSLGANGVQRFLRITLPTIRYALGYGVVLSIARCIGEFGAVKVVSGHVIGKTQTVTLLVDERAEQAEVGDYQLAVVLVFIAVLAIVAVSFLRPKENR